MTRERRRQAARIEPGLLREYLEDCRSAVARARKAFGRFQAAGAADASAEVLKVFGHQIAGSGGTYGFPEAGEAGRSLDLLMKESIAAGRGPDDGLVEEIGRRIDEIERELGLGGA